MLDLAVELYTLVTHSMPGTGELAVRIGCCLQDSLAEKLFSFAGFVQFGG
jgi:hypothetical protein